MAKKKTASSRPQSKKAGSMPPTLDTPDFLAAWSEWQRFTAERGIELSTEDAERQLALLAKLGAEEAIAEVRKTMAEHPLKDRKAGKKPKAEGERKATDKSSRKAAANQKAAKEQPEAKAKPRKAREQETKKPSALDAAAKVLAEKGEPMTCKEMIETMAAKGYWQSPGGQTPSATLYSAILRELKVKDNEARFEKVARGQFRLRSK